MRLALRILRPHSLTLTVSLSHCLSHLSHLSHLFLISLISLSLSLSLSLSPLCLSCFRLSSLSSLAGGSGQRATYKGLFIPRCPPLSHSGALAFAPPLASSPHISVNSFMCRGSGLTMLPSCVMLFIRFTCMISSSMILNGPSMSIFQPSSTWTLISRSFNLSYVVASHLQL